MRIHNAGSRLEFNPGGAVAKPGNLRESSHIGFVSHNPRHWRRIVFPFLAQGLARGERCLYLTTIHPPKLIAALLAQDGVDAEKARARGQFSTQDAAQIQMPQGWFDPDHVIRQHEKKIGKARREGFAGLRIVVDMAWASYTRPGWDRLEEYEHRVGAELCLGHSLKMMCCYDDLLFQSAVISSVKRTHAVLIGTQADSKVVGPLDLGRPGTGIFEVGPRRGGWPKGAARWPGQQQSQPRL